MKLFKLSAPGWERDYDNESELKAELYNHICGLCCKEDSITEFSAINDMLGTDCGCEYDVEL